MHLGIVIVSFNTRDQTLACLNSVFENAPTGTEVIVVDNGSRDGTGEAIRDRHPSVVVDEAGENLGFAKGVNRGVSQSSANFVLLLNPDTIVLPGSLADLMSFATGHPQFGVFGGRTLRPDGTTDPSSCWGEATMWSLTSFALGLSTAFKRSPIFDPESLGHWDRDTVRVVPIVTGCLLLIRRADWERVGGMDEDFFLYGEDAEFALRTRRAGLISVVVPEAVIVHEVGGSTSSSGLKMSMVMAGKSTLLQHAWSPMKAALGVTLLVAGSGLRAALEKVTHRAGAWTTVWQRRADWRQGYPKAKFALLAPGAAEAEPPFEP
ncbi:MAG: glycosyltransferase family 2 protein [Microbacteriaceae bacterium]